MPVLALGVSYRRAGVSLLERLAFTEEGLPKAYRRLRDAEEVSEAVVLSTCNRVEVYAAVASYHAGFQELKRFLADDREIDPEEFADPLYSHYESEAAEHLFSVAAGIDSVVLGEPQILQQVRQAYRRAAAEGTTGPLLSALFRGAVRAGRRARSETSIGSSPAAFVQAGVALAERSLGPLRGRPAAVIGAGAMARLAAAHLRERAIGPIRIVNRTLERAARLAERTGGEPVRLDALGDVLRRVDLVVSSTGASGTVVGRPDVEQAVRARDGRPLFLLDLAVPRDVAPDVAGLGGVTVADLDVLKADLLDGPGQGEDDLIAVRGIVAQEVARFEGWRRAARLAPLIQALKDRGERAVAAELQRLGPKLAGLSEREREAVEAVARGVAAKLLHHPIVRLRQASAGGEAATRTVAELFDLELPKPE